MSKVVVPPAIFISTKTNSVEAQSTGNLVFVVVLFCDCASGFFCWRRLQGIYRREDLHVVLCLRNIGGAGRHTSLYLGVCLRSGII